MSSPSHDISKAFSDFCKLDAFCHKDFAPDPSLVNDAALRCLSEHKKWEEVYCLDFCGARQFTDEGLNFLPPHVFRLNLAGTGITSKGLSSLPRLILELNLSDTRITGLTKTFRKRHRLLRKLDLSRTRIRKGTLLPFLPKGLQILNLTDTDIMFNWHMVGASIGTFRFRQEQVYLQAIQSTRGFSWRVNKKGYPTHYLVGLCHWVSRYMNQNPSLLKSLKESQIIFTERGEKSGSSLLEGWPASADGFVREYAFAHGRELRGLDVPLGKERRNGKREIYAICQKGSRQESAVKRRRLDVNRRNARDAVGDQKGCQEVALKRCLFPMSLVKNGYSLQEMRWNEIVATWICGDDEHAMQLEAELEKAHLGRFRTSLWMLRLLPAMKAGKSVGIFPGYLHTVGPEGLVQLLKNKGWTVTRI